MARESSRVIRVVADTNIFISAYQFGGLPGQFMQLALSGKVQLVTSSTLLEELTAKLSEKFLWRGDKVAALHDQLSQLCEVVSTLETLHVIQADPDDDRVLECAVAGHADSIVTGDHHLLDLSEFRGIPILTVRQFMDRLDPAS